MVLVGAEATEDSSGISDSATFVMVNLFAGLTDLADVVLLPPPGAVFIVLTVDAEGDLVIKLLS